MVEKQDNLEENRDIEEGNTNNLEKTKEVIGVGVFVWMLTLIGTRMGGGIVGIPYATQQIGFLTALCFQIVYSIMAVFAIFLLLKVREITGDTSLSSIGYYCYGRISIFFINSMIAVGQLGFVVIFFIVFGDVAGGLIEKINTSGISFWSSRWFTHTILAIWMLYLILKKEIHQLKYAGFSLLILIIVFIILFLVHFITSHSSPSQRAELTSKSIGVKQISYLTTFATSYSIHPSFFTAFIALKNQNLKSGIKTAILAELTLFFVYISTPLISFGLYGANIKSNMLKNVADDTGVLSVVLLIIFLLIAVIHVPIIFFFGKEGLLIVFDEVSRRSYSVNNPSNKIKSTPKVEVRVIEPTQIENRQNVDIQNNEPNLQINTVSYITSRIIF